MDKTNRLGKERVSRLLLSFSLPAIVGMLVNASYNVIDRAFIGHGVGSLGIAGITMGFPIMIIIMAFGMLVGIGATSLVSIRLGEQNKEGAEKVIGNALVMLVGISVVFTILALVFLNPLLRAFGATEEVLPYARDYMSIIVLGTLFSSIGFGMNNFIRAEGKPMIAMLTMFISAIVNFILAYIFIFLFKWGMKGAGLATVLAQLFSAVWVFSYFVRGKSILKLRYRNLKPDWKLVGRVSAIGAPSFAMQLAASLLNIILNKSLVYYGGDIAVSGMGIINSLQLLLIMPVVGVSQGAQPIIGYNYGAQLFNRVTKTLKLAVIASTIVVLIGYTATRLFPTQFISVFTSDVELINFGSHALLIFFFFLPVVGFQIISSNYFQAVGKMTPALILTLSRQVLILIPAMLILPLYYGLDGVLYAGPLADLLSSLLTGLWLWKELRHLKFRHEESTAA